MIRRGLLIVVTALLLIAVVQPAPRAMAAAKTDRVRTAKSSDTGDITDMSPQEVTLEKSTGGGRKFAVNEIRVVQFDSEPSELTQARINAKNGAYTTAQQLLQGIDKSKLDRDAVREDVEFYMALCAAKLALGGSGEINDAGKQLNDFVRAHPKNYHYYEAVETMGDLLTASEKYPAAQKQYEELAKAPWPEYKMRAAVLIGRSLQAQSKHDDAVKQFDAALAISDDTEGAKSQKLSATLGKAVSLAQTEHADDAVRMIEEVIQNADPEQKELQARAYNALGNCYEKAGKSKDALLAYLHVDVLYSTVPDAHAEALEHLIPLWQSIGEEARAREARQMLNDKYGGGRKGH
jgi:tetratricopeptide (TPR) repeat protein